MVTASLQESDVTGLATRTFFFQQSSVVEAQTEAITLRIPAGRLRVEEFRYIWVRRLPLVVTDIKSRMQLSWSPDQLTADYGEQNCIIEDCEGYSGAQKVTLAMFMKQFDDKTDNVIWKLKVWRDHLLITLHANWTQNTIGLASPGQVRSVAP
jgi:hypothetical protein